MFLLEFVGFVATKRSEKISDTVCLLLTHLLSTYDLLILLIARFSWSITQNVQNEATFAGFSHRHLFDAIYTTKNTQKLQPSLGKMGELQQFLLMSSKVTVGLESVGVFFMCFLFGLLVLFWVKIASWTRGNYANVVGSFEANNTYLPSQAPWMLRSLKLDCMIGLILRIISFQWLNTAMRHQRVLPAKLKEW